jgi:predicted ferric reductase
MAAPRTLIAFAGRQRLTWADVIGPLALATLVFATCLWLRVSAVAIVVCRLALPAWRSLYHRMRVTAVNVEGPGAVSVTVEGHRLNRLRTKSGQFFIWRFLDGPGWSRGNPYTISAAPDDERLRVTIRATGARRDQIHTEDFAW